MIASQNAWPQVLPGWVSDADGVVADSDAALDQHIFDNGPAPQRLSAI